MWLAGFSFFTVPLPCVIVRHGVLDEGVSFIGKPYAPLALARKVREVLDTQ